MFDLRTMNLEEINKRLFEIPKVELHCHLELAFRPSTLREWAIEDGIDVALGMGGDVGEVVVVDA